MDTEIPTDVSELIGSAPAALPDVLPDAPKTNYPAYYQEQYKQNRGPELEKQAEERQAKIDSIESQKEADDIAAQKELADLAIKSRQDFIKGEMERPQKDIEAPQSEPLTMKDVQSNMFPLLIMATIAGKGQRRHAVGAMSAFAAMIHGAEEGKKEKYEAEKKNYDAAVAQLEKNQKEYESKLKAILDNDKMAYQEKMDATKILDMQYGHRINDEERAIKGLNGQIDKTKAVAMNLTKLKEAQDAIDMKARAQLKTRQEADKSFMTPGAMEDAAWNKLLYGQEVKGLANASGKIRERVASLADSIGRQLGLTPQEMVSLPRNNQAKQKALSNMINWGAGVEKAQQQLQSTFAAAVKAFERLSIKPGQIQSLNKAILNGQREFNDPDANAYAFWMNTVRTEYARMMSGPTSNAMLPVEAARRADDSISNTVNMASLLELKKSVDQEAKFSRDSVQNQVQALNASMQNPYDTRSPQQQQVQVPSMNQAPQQAPQTAPKVPPPPGYGIL